jgi:26S proteasome regulatory subunit N3
MTKDVEMKDADSKSGADAAPKEPAKKEPPTAEELAELLKADIRKNISLIEKTVQAKETRLMSRVLRTISSTRRRITTAILKDIINQSFPDENSAERNNLIKTLDKVPAEPQPMEIAKEDTASAEQRKATSLLPEVEIYLHLLVVIYLIDKKLYNEAVISSTQLVERLNSFNRRTLNPLSAKVYFYYSYSYEKANRLEEIRSALLAYHRTASLRHNEEAQASLLNLLLRNYLKYNLYDQADKLISKTTFREEVVSTNQHARYLYYQGKIKSVQLDYTEAYRCLLGAIRKAPANSAKGFRISAYKLLTIVQLLMGEIPERSIFRQPGLKQALLPYFKITQAVRIGDLNAFKNVVTTNQEVFKQDKTYTLIQRLRHNVIKTGLRKINTSYSRISFDDICAKLHLESGEDAEFIVAKAIRDGVISATINHDEKYVQSKETLDIYSTTEPQKAFHRRITFCLNTHNEAIKAMRFEPNAHKPSAETLKERREREQEIAKNLEEEEWD